MSFARLVRHARVTGRSAARELFLAKRESRVPPIQVMGEPSVRITHLSEPPKEEA